MNAAGLCHRLRPVEDAVVDEALPHEQVLKGELGFTQFPSQDFPSLDFFQGLGRPETFA